MEQNRQQGRRRNQRARGQGTHQRGGHEPHQRGQRSGHGPRQRGGYQREGGRRQGTVVSNEVRAIVVDHVVNRGLTMAEVDRLVHPNLRRSTVNSIMRTFGRICTMLYHYIYNKLHCNACKFTKPVTVFLQYDLVTVYSVLPSELTEGEGSGGNGKGQE